MIVRDMRSLRSIGSKRSVDSTRDHVLPFDKPINQLVDWFIHFISNLSPFPLIYDLFSNYFYLQNLLLKS